MLIGDDTKLFFMGDSLQRIYGFIGAVPNLLQDAERRYNLQLISLEKNYRFASNENMLQLDKIIRQNALTPFENPNNLRANVNFILYENQELEATGIIYRTREILQQAPSAKVAIITKQRGPNINHIIDAFNKENISFFYGLFTDEDIDYVKFNRKCLFEFIELLRDNSKINKKIPP